MPPEAAFDQEAFRRTLRIALAVAIGLTIAEARDQPFAFLTPMFAVLMLAKSQRVPSLAQGFGLAVILAVGSWLALSFSNLLLDRPVAYLLLVSVIFFGCFWLMARGKGGPAPQLLLISNVMIPVVAVLSREAAADLAVVMIDAGIGAPLLVWLVHAVLPSASTSAAPQPVSSLGQEHAAGAALLALVVLMLPFVFLMLHPEEASFVILITIIGIVSQRPDARGLVVIGLLLGNLIGGVAASAAFYVMTLLPWLAMLFLLTLLVGLILAGYFYGTSRLAPVFGVALQTFLILFGLGLSPIGEGSAAAFVSRLVDVALASVYALGALALLTSVVRLPGKARA
jgi:hypothetical protein